MAQIALEVLNALGNGGINDKIRYQQVCTFHKHLRNFRFSALTDLVVYVVSTKTRIHKLTTREMLQQGRHF